MRKIKEVLRLHWDLGLSMRQSARSLSVAASSVSDLVQRAKAAGLGWPLPDALDEAELERALYRGNQGRPRRQQRPRVDLREINRGPASCTQAPGT